MRTGLPLAAVLLATIVPASGAVARPKLPKLLREVEAKYGQASTLVAEFTQVNESAALKQKKTSSGVLMVKRPDKVRWETLKPDPNLMVSDGKKFWFYTPPFDEDERGQVIERKKGEVQSKLANTLLSGSFSSARDIRVKKKDASHFTLSLKPGAAGSITQAEIEVDPEKKLIQRVVLQHKGGNRSEISLDKIELGKELTDDIFTFKAPANTDRVE